MHTSRQASRASRPWRQPAAASRPPTAACADRLDAAAARPLHATARKRGRDKKKKKKDLRQFSFYEFATRPIFIVDSVTE